LAASSRRTFILAAVLAACATDSSAPPTPVETVDIVVADPSFAVGAAIQLQITLRDASGAVLSGRTIIWSTSDSSVATVSGTGVVSGVGLGSAIITATSEGVSDSVAVTIVAGPAAVLTFTTQPTTVAAGTAINPGVEVTARDAFGNVATSFTGVVAAAIAANPGGATLSGTTVATAVNGVATFPNLLINKTAVGYTLYVTSGSLTSTASTPFNVLPGAASELAFTALPGSAHAGVTIAPAIVVNARDALGNLVTSYSGSVDIALAANPAGGTLSGTLSVTAIAGVAAFADLSIDKASPSYTFAVAGAGMVPDTSSTLAILAGPVSPSHSTVQAAPASIMASTGSSATTVTVTARDQFDNPVVGAGVVLGASGTGNTVTQPVATTDAGGVATGSFSSTVAESKTVSASAAGVGVTQTAVVTVTPAVNGQLVFIAQPATSVAGVAIAPAVKVAVQDAFGNTFTSFTGNVTVALGANPGNDVLGGTKTKAAVAGEATFTDLQLVKAATGYTLAASAGGIANGASTSFNITPAPVSAAQSSVVVGPASITASTGSSAATITVTARDAFDNLVSGASVVLAASGTGNSVTQPGGPTGPNGVATGTISSTASGSKTVSATINTVVAVQQPAVTVNPAAIAASQSQVVATPTSIAASFGGVTATIAVTAKDTFGNVIPGLAAVLAASGTGNTVTQPAAMTDANGVATGSLSSTATGDKIVSASVASVPVTQTAGVTVVPGEVSVTQSTLLAAPATITASNGSVVSTITVTARDDQGNVIPGVNVALAATGSSNVLTQPAGVTNASGVASGTLSSTLSGNRVLTATIAGTGIDQADTVIVTAATPAGSAFLVQPSSMTVGTTMAPPVQVEIRDQFGNRVTSATNGVMLSIGTNPGGGALSGGGAVAAVAGVASFPNLSINAVGSGYTLKATIGGIPDVVSNAFNVTSGVVSAAQSTVVAAPPSFTAGGSSTITVTARDAGGFPVVGATVALSVSGSGNTITQPSGPADANGVATGSFSSTAAGSKTVTATANGITITQKPVVTVNAGAVSASVSTVSAAPSSIVAGSGTATITVTVKDGFGNPVSGSTVVLSATGSGNTLTQPAGATGGTGIATGTLASTVAGNKTVSATASGISVTQTAPVTVTSAGTAVTFVGAGDIADCGNNNDAATAALINAMPSNTPVFVLGDNVYPNGTATQFTNCYGPTWGVFKSRTHPSAGNHEYNSSNATPYFNYFGAAAGTAGQGWYSFDLGAWHIIVLNSNLETKAGSPQDNWLLADLAAHNNVCTLAYWHHPLYSSIGGSGNGGAVITSARRYWDDLYAHGVDLVLNGHRHVYERLARMKPDGSPDPVNGIRTIIAGMGGESGGDLTNIFPTSQVREGHTYGVLKLTLSATSYSWEFVGVPGSTFTDTGTENCH
jgi:hypothetical protein